MGVSGCGGALGSIIASTSQSRPSVRSTRKGEVWRRAYGKNYRCWRLLSISMPESNGSVRGGKPVPRSTPTGGRAGQEVRTSATGGLSIKASRPGEGYRWRCWSSHGPNAGKPPVVPVRGRASASSGVASANGSRSANTGFRFRSGPIPHPSLASAPWRDGHGLRGKADCSTRLQTLR